MKNRNLKNIRHLLIPGIMTVFLAGGTCAYYSANLTFANPFHTGVPGVALSEKFNPADQWVPGEKKQKEVWFKNEGTLPVFIRFKPEIQWIAVAAPDHAITLDWSDEFQSQWVKKGEYYYYNKVLVPGSETGQVLKSVTFDPELTNDEHGDADYSKTQCNVSIVMNSIIAETKEAAVLWNMVPEVSPEGAVNWTENSHP